MTTDQLAQPAATLAAALISRMPAPAEVTPQAAAALYFEVYAALRAEQKKPPNAPPGGIYG